MQKFQEELLKRRQKKETRLFKKQEKSDKRKILPRRKLHVFFKTLRIKGKHFQKRIIKL